MEYHGYAWDVGRLYACLKHLTEKAARATAWSLVKVHDDPEGWELKLVFGGNPEGAVRPVCAGHDPVHDTI